ncbi:hypothetical protein ES703_49458 [subsurface metagenome]
MFAFSGGDIDRIFGLLKEISVTFFALAQGTFRALAHGDVRYSPEDSMLSTVCYQS